MPLLPNKVRGKKRVDDWRVLTEFLWVLCLVRRGPKRPKRYGPHYAALQLL